MFYILCKTFTYVLQICIICTSLLRLNHPWYEETVEIFWFERCKSCCWKVFQLWRGLFSKYLWLPWASKSSNLQISVCPSLFMSVHPQKIPSTKVFQSESVTKQSCHVCFKNNKNASSDYTQPICASAHLTPSAGSSIFFGLLFSYTYSRGKNDKYP